jgi:hypothetical protein
VRCAVVPESLFSLRPPGVDGATDMKSRSLFPLFIVGANLFAVALVVTTAALSAPAIASSNGPAASYHAHY